MSTTFEGAGGFDLAGWTHAPLHGTVDWTWSAAQHKDGAHSWFAQDIATVSDMCRPELLVGHVQPTVGPRQDAQEDSPGPGVVADVRRSLLHVVRADKQSGMSGGTERRRRQFGQQGGLAVLVVRAGWL